MKKYPKMLLVEGENDKSFFTACCRKIGLEDKIWVGPPNGLGDFSAGKDNAIKLLSVLIELASRDESDERIEAIGLVVDADFPAAGGLGFAKTWERISHILRAHAYVIPDVLDRSGKGFCFQHNDGLPQIGLWIMPDNLSQGLLEDFVKKSVVGTEKSLLQHAEQAVAGLKAPKFKPHHLSKAELATWLAWQAMPGQGMAGAVGGQLLDFKKGPSKLYIDWLAQVFS
jgi:hypothetical protein